MEILHPAQRKSPGILFLLISIGLFLMCSSNLEAASEDLTSPDADYGAAEARKLAELPKHWITADHSEFEALQQDFTSGPEVTEACLSCHNEAAEQIHETIHWTWICPADPNEVMGKNGKTMNNF